MLCYLLNWIIWSTKEAEGHLEWIKNVTKISSIVIISVIMVKILSCTLERQITLWSSSSVRRQFFHHHRLILHVRRTTSSWWETEGREFCATTNLFLGLPPPQPDFQLIRLIYISVIWLFCIIVICRHHRWTISWKF